MATSYKELRKLLIGKDMRKEEVHLKVGIITTAMTK